MRLEGRSVRCPCGRSTAHRERPGWWSYAGPSEVALTVVVHEPERHRMGTRIVPVPDDDLTRHASTASVP